MGPAISQLKAGNDVIELHPRYDTLGAMIRGQADRLGDKIALRCGERETSYSGVLSLAESVAGALISSGIVRGDRIGWLGKNSDLYYPLLLGTALAGAVMVPLNWRLADPEIDWLLADAAVRLLFLGEEREGEAERFELRVTGLDECVVVEGSDQSRSFEAFLARSSGSVFLPAEDPDATALQLYTSGTTGQPKGALLSHRALLYFRSLPADEQPDWNRWTEDDVSLVAMPQFHIGGTGFGLQTLCAGATGIVMREFDAGAVLSFIERERLSKLFIVPSAMQMLQRHPSAPSIDYTRIRTIAYGASPIPLAQLRDALKLFCCGFVQQYGMTESAGTICALPPGDHDADGNARMLSAGKALPWCDIAILDARGAGLPAHSSGEIALRGPTLMAGYWKRPDETSAAFTPDGWFRTGDAGYLDERGYLFVVDRVKDMIVSGGENVYPAEVEKALVEHPEVAEAAVIGIPDDRWGEAVHAVVVLGDDSTLDCGALRAWLRGRIAGFKIPKAIDFAEALPRNAGGKILRREVRAPFWRGRARQIS